MKQYSPKDIEAKWQKAWEDNGTYVVDLADHSKPKYYGMSMLPGITGAGIHIGHGRTFQFSDIKVRAKRQQGFNAYNPIGWDSFGLPVENYAIKVGKKPREAHDEAKVHFKNQLKRLGYSYDWSKEISTADPEYYKWTQWIFNKLYEHDLAYQKESPQWWCDTDNTVLANEQVEGGKCWRCGNLVTKRNLKQWFFRITAYADEILDATDDLDWTPMVKTMQKNWIGRSKGAEVDFAVAKSTESIKVFTTRPDTLFGATFMVMAPEHPLVAKITTKEMAKEVQEYIKKAQQKSEIDRMDESREKTGVFTGAYAINPVNNEPIPIWIADYVLYGYGTGAIMAVPAHDQRDFEFAQKYELPIKLVIEPITGEAQENPEHRQSIVAVVEDPKIGKLLSINWGQDNGGSLFIGGGLEEGENPIECARREITEETGYQNVEFIAQTETVHHNYFAHSKNVARQIDAIGLHFRLIDDKRQEAQLAADEEGKFKVEWLDPDEAERLVADPLHSYVYERLIKGEVYAGDGVMVNSGKYDGLNSALMREQIIKDLKKQKAGKERVNYKMRDWLISRQRYWGAPIPIIHCAKDGAVPVPDDQLPVILPDVEDYKPTGGNTSVLAGVEEWVNTQCPKCGGSAKRETDTMDGYACSSWYFLRYLDPFNDKEAWDPKVIKHWAPVDFYNGADHAVAHLLYARFWMRFFHKIGLVSTSEPFQRMMYNAYILAHDGQKMSKSKNNVIDPLEIIDSGYGADSLRLYEMFIAPYDQEAPWDTRGVPGTHRFLNRVWNIVQEYLETKDAKLTSDQAQTLLRATHKMIKKVTEDIENEKFNTAISTMMETLNTFYKLKTDGVFGKSDEWKFAIESLLQILSPFTPHITEELWQQLGHSDTIHIDHWPEWDEKYIAEDLVTVVVQINGKVRAQISVAAGSSEDRLESLALANDKIKPHLEGKTVAKTIVVPNKLVNIVVK